MSIDYPVEPEIDPDDTEESPEPDDENNDDKRGIAEDDPNEVTGE